MPYNKVPKDHTEFGGGPGLVDPVLRKDRLLSPEEERMELMFTRSEDPSSTPESAVLGSNVTEYKPDTTKDTNLGTQ